MTFIPYRPCERWTEPPLWQRLLNRLTRGAYMPPEQGRCGECVKCRAHAEAIEMLERFEREHP